MSESKDSKNSSAGDGTGNDTDKNTPTTMGFGELLGHIDSRIETLLSKRTSKDGGGTEPSKGGTGDPSASDPQSVREQLRAELAKLQGEEAEKRKEVDRDVTIAELKETVTKLTEVKPVENMSRLTRIMWGK